MTSLKRGFLVETVKIHQTELFLFFCNFGVKQKDAGSPIR